MSQITLESLYKLNNNRLIRLYNSNNLTQIISDLNQRGLLSDKDKEIHNSKSLKLIMETPQQILKNRYHITSPRTTGLNAREKRRLLSLKIYRNGVNFTDLIYAIYQYNDLVTGVLDYIPQPGEIIEGVYEKSGKVEKSKGEGKEIDPNNPYTYIGVKDLRIIADSRNIDIPKPSHTVIMSTLLNNYDQVFPEWKQEIINSEDASLSRFKLKFKLAIEGINIKMATHIAFSELLTLIRVNRIIKPTQSPVLPRAITPLYQGNEVIYLSQAFDLTNNLGYIINSDLFKMYNRLAKYPTYLSLTNYNKIYNTNSVILRISLINKYGPDVKFLDENGLKFLATRGYIDPNVNIINIKSRYNTIKDYPNSLIYKLSQIYDIDEPDKYNQNKYIIARLDPHPLESVAINFKPILDSNDPSNVTSEYSKSIGMIIPPNIENKSSYFWNNLDKYNKVITRPSTIGPIDKDLLSPGLISPADLEILLSRYTDNEIFQYTGVYIPYQSRDDIINNIINIRNQDRFFIPTVRNCSNEDTITTLEETNDMSVFIVAFGNIFEYVCYDLDDFIQNFREYAIEGLEDERVFEFRKPEDPNNMFNLSDIKPLVSVIELYKNIPDSSQVLELIRDGLTRTVSMTEYDRRTLLEFDNLPNNDKPLIKAWLQQLFLTGMYMRRWLGPGSPYPLTDASSQGPDPNTKVNNAMTILGYHPLAKISSTQYQPFSVGGITAKLSENGKRFVNNLRAVEYKMSDEGIREPNQKSQTIGTYLDKVRKGTYCIRMASSYFIGTGFYYLRNLFKHIVPNYDPSSLERIV